MPGPCQAYLHRLAQVLPTHVAVHEIIASFPALRPTAVDLKIRHSLEKLRLHPESDPRRRDLENDLATELVPEARRMALNAAWRLRRPDYAEEVWGEAIFIAIRRHDPERGLFLAYLNSSIRGLMQDMVRSGRQTGTTTILKDYGTAVRDAEDILSERLGQAPTDDQIAEHLDLRPGLVAEVKRAQAACIHVGSDDLDFLLQRAVDVFSPTDAADGDIQIRRLRDMPEEWREIIYMHFHDRLPVDEIIAETGLSEGEVLSTIEHAVNMLRVDPEAC